MHLNEFAVILVIIGWIDSAFLFWALWWLIDILSRLKIICLEKSRDDARKKYRSHKSNYVNNCLGRPLEKLSVSVKYWELVAGVKTKKQFYIIWVIPYQPSRIWMKFGENIEWCKVTFQNIVCHILANLCSTLITRFSVESILLKCL
jgi:hypothetical protein